MWTRNVRNLVVAVSVGTLLAGCGGGSSSNAVVPPGLTKTYKQTNLVSDLAGKAATVDANLINPWGIAATSSGPFWISDNNSGFSTLYSGTGAKIPLTVTVPPPTGGAGTAAPTGIIANTTTDFKVGGFPSSFVFSTEDGTLSGWYTGGAATLTVDNSQVPAAATGAVYKGLAMQKDSTGANFLYATNFRSGFVEIYDATFKKMGQFTDTTVPAGFAPFGVASAPGGVLISFAKQNAAKHDDVAAVGSGYVDLFTPAGVLIRRIASQGTLNSPWGMAYATTAFGRALLVGNFGDGHINAYDADNDTFLGQLKDASGSLITIEGLWGLSFGNGASSGPVDTLYFTAGISNGTDPTTREQHGLFGSITAN